MRVARLHGPRDVRLHDEPSPAPGPGEVLVRVEAVGLCGSDLHWFEEGGIGSSRITRPIVPGHEMAGRTEDGRLVAIEPAIPCGRCPLCLEGHPNLCPTIRFSGQGADDGSMREWMAWPRHCLFPLPDGLTAVDGAMLEPLGVAIHTVTLPMAEYQDTRQAAGLSYSRRFGSHLPSASLSYSKESDYRSQGISLVDSWELFGKRSTFHLGMGILQDKVSPVNMTEEFVKERALSADGLKAAKDNPGAAVRYYFQKAYFGAHPMGHLASGTESSLGKMTVQAVKDFYKTHYRPDRAIAAIVGDIDKAKLLPLLEGTVGRMARPSGAAAPEALPAIPRPRGRKLVLVDKPDATQAYFVLGGPGYAMDSIRLRLRSDVPVGTCLSGGLDSSSIVCLANQLMFNGATIDPVLVGERQKTFSSCSEIPTCDERPYIE